MSDASKPVFAGPLFTSGVTFSSEMTRRLCERGEAVTKAICEWNTEVSQLLNHCSARNGEVIGRMTSSQSLPEVVALQTQWFRDITDDYLKGMSRLVEVNNKLLSELLGAAVSETRPAAETRPSSAKMPMRAAG